VESNHRMKNHNSLNRRQFLKHSSTAAAFLAAAPWLTQGQGNPNARINIGLIGTGDRCQILSGEIFKFADQENVRITAVCDVWQRNLDAMAAKVKERFGAEPYKTTRFGEILRRKDIDAVVIATHDSAHAPILLAALEAGKDVYIEKPMCLDIQSANKALDLARANHCVVQAGTQRRSEGHFVALANEIRSGTIGKINRISAAMYVNQARWARAYAECKETDVDWDAFMFDQKKKADFDPKLIRRWHLYRRFTNGIPGLWMTHYADLIHFITGTSHPNTVVANGGKYVWTDDREHADTFHALLDYSEGFLFSWAMGLGNGSGVHFTIHGTQGTIDAEKWTVSSDGGNGTKFEARQISPAPSQNHMENWLQCLRTRKRPAADIECGHQHVISTVMAATAFETGRRQKYDSQKRAIIAA
jgi:predicted dehydrogenase